MKPAKELCIKCIGNEDGVCVEYGFNVNLIMRVNGYVPCNYEMETRDEDTEDRDYDEDDEDQDYDEDDEDQDYDEDDEDQDYDEDD